MRNPKITIPMTERDCLDILEGGEHNWTFPTNDGQSIDVVIVKEE